MFESKANNTKINKAQKQALRIVYNGYRESLKELLDIAAGTTIHTKYLQLLMTQVDKSMNHHNPEFMRFFL